MRVGHQCAFGFIWDISLSVFYQDSINCHHLSQPSSYKTKNEFIQFFDKHGEKKPYNMIFLVNVRVSVM